MTQHDVWVKWSDGKVSVCHSFEDLEDAIAHAQWHRDNGRAATVEKDAETSQSKKPRL